MIDANLTSGRPRSLYRKFFSNSTLSFIFIFLIAFCFLGKMSVSHAANSIESDKTQTSIKSRGRPFHGTIKLVDYTQNFIVLEGKSAQKFFVSPQTAIKIDGSTGKFNQIESGKYVGGYAREETGGRWVATTLNVYSDKSKTK